MRKEKISTYAILISILGPIVGGILGNLINKYNFLPAYKDQDFNYSIFLATILAFSIIALIIRFLSKRKNIDLVEENTLEDLKDNYILKKKVLLLEAVSIFLIMFFIQFVTWMSAFDATPEYCFFLCTITETIVIGILLSIISSLLIVSIRYIFKKRKSII